MIERVDSLPESEIPIESQLLSYLQRNGFPKLKSIDFQMLAITHESKGDAEKILEFAKGADVFVPEFPAMAKGGGQRIQEVFDGRRSAETIAVDEKQHYDGIFTNTLLRGLENSGIRLAVADVPADSSEFKEIRKAFKRYADFRKTLLRKKLSRHGAAELFRSRLFAFANANIAREEYIQDNIGPEIAKAYKHDSSASDKMTLKVRMYMGQAHVSLSERLRQLHPGTRRVLSDELLVHDPVTEAERRMIFKLPVSRELLDDALMSYIFTSAGIQPIADATNRWTNFNLFMRETIAGMSTDDRDRAYRAYFGDQKEVHQVFDEIVTKQKSTEDIA